MKFSKKIILVIVSIIVLYAGFLLFSDLEKISTKLYDFKFEFLPIIIFFTISSWFCVYFRWNYLLKSIGVTIPHKQNFQIFMGAGALGITPGKVGELFKSQFLKEKFDVPRSKSAPLIIAEKFYDLIGALIISSLGIWFLPELGYIIIFGLFCMILFFKILNSKTIFQKILKLFQKIQFLKNLLEPLSSSHEILKASLSGKNLSISILLSLIYWTCAGFSCYFILQGFGIQNIPLLHTVSTYSSSILAGALTLIPGGIGIAEGSLVGLFTIQGIDYSEAFVLVIFIRLFTLWFTTITGFIMIKTSNSLSTNS